MAEQKIAIRVGDLYLEVEGSPELFESFQAEITHMKDLIRGGIVTPPNKDASISPTSAMPSVSDDPTDFGELLLRLPNSVTATDQMLVAGYFAQRQNPDNVFATRDASGLLLEQGVKVGNPSQCMTNNLKAKRVFKVGSSYRVSRTGVDYVSEMQRANG